METPDKIVTTNLGVSHLPPNLKEAKNKASLFLGLLFFVVAIAMIFLTTEVAEEIFRELHKDYSGPNDDIGTLIFVGIPVSFVYCVAIGLIGARIDPSITIAIIMGAMAILGVCHYWSMV